MSEYSPHQKRIIERYYDQRDEIMLAKLGEIVTELFLADSDARRKRLWSRATSAMKTLNVPANVAEHIITQAKPEILARRLREWLDQARKAKRS
jgi:hypothetical protein